MVDPTPGVNAVLPFGTFYGRVDVRRHAPGLEIAVLNADPHRVVERHSHEEAHFVLVLSGLYVSTAAGRSSCSIRLAPHTGIRSSPAPAPSKDDSSPCPSRRP
jgi:hypothetical protein